LDGAQGAIVEVTGPFLEQRAVALARVLLTRHPGVIVARSFDDYGYDLQVNITQKNYLSGRVFGVVLKARIRLDGIGRLVKGNRIRLRGELSKALTKSAHLMRDLPFPLLFIAFSMDSDRAFYGWLRKPSQRARRLENPSVEFATEWFSETHVDVIGEVQQWYEAG
jgi:Domain of unknown function (DUF4365)